MCADVCTDMCLDLCMNMCIDVCMNMYIDVCMNMCIDVCIDVWKICVEHVYRSHGGGSSRSTGHVYTRMLGMP